MPPPPPRPGAPPAGPTSPAGTRGLVTLSSVELYAAYGSNMDPAQMAERCPHSPQRGTGWLEGWRLTFGGEDINWEGARATVVEDAAHPSGCMIPALTRGAWAVAARRGLASTVEWGSGQACSTAHSVASSGRSGRSW